MSNEFEESNRGIERCRQYEEASKTAVNYLLSKKCSIVGFQRYRRALSPNPHVFWDHKTVQQWEADREFFNDAYASKRDVTFEGAEKYAHEQLFLRCCDQ